MRRYLIFVVLTALAAIPFVTLQAGALDAQQVEHPQHKVAHAQAVSKSSVLEKDSTPPTKPTATLPSDPTPPAQQPIVPVVPAPISYTDHDAIMAAAGISAGDYTYVDYIVSHESGWCPTKWEGEAGACPGSTTDFFGLTIDVDVTLTSKGYGECQSTPANKMALVAADYLSNPVTQLEWCNSYAVSRYGGWYGAYLHWLNNHNW